MLADETVVYATAGDVELSLDVIAPAGRRNRSAVILLHAGGWNSGHRGWMHDRAQALAAHGFVALAVQYRLTTEAPWPAQIQDVKAAICWVRANADRLEIDADKIVLYGASAGGHLALLAAGTPGHATFDPRSGGSSTVAAVVAIHAPTTLYMPGERPAHASPAAWLLGKAATITRARVASPTTYVSGAFPPTLLLHGTADQVIHHAASQWMYDALFAVGAPVDLHLYHGQGHGFSALPSMARMIEAETLLFLDRAVVDPARYREEAERCAAPSGPAAG